MPLHGAGWVMVNMPAGRTEDRSGQLQSWASGTEDLMSRQCQQQQEPDATGQTKAGMGWGVGAGKASLAGSFGFHSIFSIAPPSSGHSGCWQDMCLKAFVQYLLIQSSLGHVV